MQSSFPALLELFSLYSFLHSRPLPANHQLPQNPSALTHLLNLMSLLCPDCPPLSFTLWNVLLAQWHRVKITQDVAFSDWLLRLSNTHLSFLHDFSWLDGLSFHGGEEVGLGRELPCMRGLLGLNLPLAPKEGALRLPINLCKYRAEGEEGRVRFESCQESNIKNEVRLLITII